MTDIGNGCGVQLQSGRSEDCEGWSLLACGTAQLRRFRGTYRITSTFSSDTLLVTSRLFVVTCTVSSKDRTVDERRVKVSGSYRGTIQVLWG